MRPTPRSRTAALAALALVGAVCLLVPTQAEAYSTYYPNECNGGARWPNSYLPSPWYLNQNGYSPWSMSDLQATLNASWDVWSAPCCTRFTASFKGLTASTAMSNSQLNIISFATANWPAALGDVNGTIAVTMPGIYQDCTLRDADMHFNGVGFTFVNGQPQTQRQADLMSIAVHEMGHWLGLDHSSVNASSLWWAYSGGTGERTLHQDDIDAVCFLYNQACDCTSDASCPSGQVCQGGSCVVPPCTNNSQCATGLVCNTQSGQCVVPPCVTDSDCGAGSTCQGGTCQATSSCVVCQTCTRNADCGASGFCAYFEGQTSGRCTVACSTSGACPGDAVCYQVSDGQNAYHLCLNEDADTAGVCPASYRCGGGSAGCAGLGISCANNGAQCTPDNDLCLTSDGTNSFCSCTCATDADCGTGNLCIALQAGGRACVPGALTDRCDGRCTSSQVCDFASGQCMADVGCVGLGNSCGNGGAQCTSDNDVCINTAAGAAICSCTCSTDAECGANAECVELADGSRGCLPRQAPQSCTDTGCPTGLTCDIVTGTCVLTGEPDMGTPDVLEPTPEDTAPGQDTTPDADLSPAEDTATSGGEDVSPQPDATAELNVPGGLSQGGTGDGDCACTSVLGDQRSPLAPWSVALLGLGLVALVRRRQQRR